MVDVLEALERDLKDYKKIFFFVIKEFFVLLLNNLSTLKLTSTFLSTQDVCTC